MSYENGVYVPGSEGINYHQRYRNPNDPYGFIAQREADEANEAAAKEREEARERKLQDSAVFSFDRAENEVKKLAKIQPVVDGLIFESTQNIMVGDSGLGKSPLLMQLAVCVAAGVPFLGRETSAGKVLIADYENGIGPITRKLREVAGAVGVDLSTRAVRENLVIADCADADHVIKKAEGVKLVLVDSLRGFNAQAESKNSDAAEMLAGLAETEAAWLILHHVRKRDRSTEYVSLLQADSVLTWLEAASGGRALINQTFTRIAVDYGKADVAVRGFVKGHGEFGPWHLERVYVGDDPQGYKLAAGQSLLSDAQLMNYQRVQSQTLSFADLKRALGKKDGSAALFLKACQSAGLVQSSGAGGARVHSFVPVAMGQQAYAEAIRDSPTAEELPL
jgi:AAA domain